MQRCKHLVLLAVTAAVAIAARNRAGPATTVSGSGSGGKHEVFYSSDEESRDGSLSPGSASEDEGSDGYHKGALFTSLMVHWPK